MNLSRRTLLAASSATAVTATTTLLTSAGGAQARPVAAASAGAAATADFDTLLQRAETLLTGGGFDPADADFTAAVAALDATATGLWDTLDRGAGRTALWPDLAPLTDPGNFGQSYTRLRTLATAWATEGTSLTGSIQVADALVAALRFSHDIAYNPAKPETGNWWFWEIGAPRALMDCAVILRDRLPAADLTDYLAVVDRFCPDADRRTNSPTLSETGANRTDKAVIVALRGLLGRDAAKLVSARDALSDVRDVGRNSLFRYATSGDGFYQDGSFVQHDVVAYTGTYGVVLLSGTAYLLALLAGSEWAVADPEVSVMYEAVERTFTPVIFDGLMMDSVRGRAISRQAAGDHRDGAAAVAAILLLASGAPAEYAKRWRALVKGWLIRNRTTPFETLASLPRLALAKAVLNDGTVPAEARTTGSLVFADMDRVVHRRPGWACALSLSSKRISAYEAGNGENLHGWYTGDGMTYLYDGDDLRQYNDGFWPTVDPYRLPGTTVDTRQRTDLGTSAGTSTYCPSNAVAGGAVLDGRYVAAAMEVTGAQGTTLRARKSWFLLDNAVIALGAGITAGDGRRVETIVENRNLGADGGHRLLIDGVRQPVDQGWTHEFDGARWAHTDGVGGYVFPGGTTLHALREQRTGTWQDINSGSDTGGSADPVTRRYLTLWVDHGSSPTDAHYAYVLLPGASAAATATWSRSRPVRIVANDTTAQAVEVRRAGLTAVNFWGAGTAAGITASGPASVLVRRHGARVSVAVADPGRTLTTLSVELPFHVRSVVDADDTVSLVPGRRPVLTVTVGGSRGHTHRAELIQ
ncbi:MULTISPECIES: polysaccharide lyase 8 family protein [unclassified Streptomyces]|uniref:polysaccharide lyase 8 family protein n=1 Tax=unclassified Streptomyces TaxID=2593676 RepID=UPI002E1117AE|nr:polysaccharide lyase 8 family protein [Streptomyces sp. NBC_01241]WSP61324.1 polysaccharide lyase 8 family protein [Streptomyces sp. NBC_01240]WSU20393.1 polysaccharide lyase 8 family protein [Streptomyces sp. NBC_01108]